MEPPFDSRTYEIVLVFVAIALFLGLGAGYRVSVSPEAVVVTRTMFWVPTSRRVLPLDVTITDDLDEPNVVEIGDEDIWVPASRRQFIRDALREAVLRAGAPVKPSCHPYR